jgi:hypothetical protein
LCNIAKINRAAFGNTVVGAVARIYTEVAGAKGRRKLKS